MPLQPGKALLRSVHTRLALCVLVVALGIFVGIERAPAAPVTATELPPVGAPAPIAERTRSLDGASPASLAREAVDGRSTVHFDTLPINQIPLRLSNQPPGPRAPRSRVIEGELSKGQTLGAALNAQGVDPAVVHVVAREMRPIFDFRLCHPGDHYRLEQALDGRVVDFRYVSGPEDRYHLWRDGDGFAAKRETVELTARAARVAGVVENSLYEAIRNLGEDPQLASDFAELFAWDIDFSRTVQPGDDFKILYERLYRTDLEGTEQYVRPGRILAARYRGTAGDHTAIHFETEEGAGDYYRADGSSIQREFMVAPLRYSRISSSYSGARRHPILNVTRPHHGIDYAAPSGTPVFSVADGTVSFRGWGGGFGNLVKVSHADGYISYYAHLSRFERRLRVGQFVSQREVLGYVGQTGLATGPHVCFRVAKDGQYVNPLGLERPAAEPVPDERWVDFQLVRDTLLDELDGHTVVATDGVL